MRTSPFHYSRNICDNHLLFKREYCHLVCFPEATHFLRAAALRAYTQKEALSSIFKCLLNKVTKLYCLEKLIEKSLLKSLRSS